MIFGYQPTYHLQSGQPERSASDDPCDGIESLTSPHDKVDTVKLAGVQALRGKHKDPTCETRPLSYSKGRLVIFDQNDLQIDTDEELMRALQAGAGAQKQAYTPAQDAALPYKINAPSLGTDNPLSGGRQIEVICPDCAALTTVRLIEQAQGEDAAKEFMRSVMGGKRDDATRNQYGVQVAPGDSAYSKPSRGAYALSSPQPYS